MTSILVGIDGSVRGEKALEWARVRAERLHGRLTLLVVVDPAIARRTGIDSAEIDQVAADQLVEASQEVQRSSPSIPVETLLEHGLFAETVVQVARNFDMLVLGSHSGGNVEPTLHGAKPLRVAAMSDVPVVVVPFGWQKDASQTGVVVGVGPDHVSEGAIAFAAEQSSALHEPLTLVAVWGLPALLSRPAEAMGGGLSPVRDDFMQKLNTRAEELRSAYPGIEVFVHVVEGSPAQMLVAESRSGALLVLGTHARNALGRILFGSTSHGALAGMHVPTAIVPVSTRP